jgi:hypothetical protein
MTAPLGGDASSHGDPPHFSNDPKPSYESTTEE